MTAPKLRPYQRGCLESIWRSYETQGVNRGLVKMPTGTGKTVCFAALLEWPSIRRWLEQFPQKERRMLVIAHREELLDQAADKIQRANPDLQVMVEQGDRHAGPFSDVVIASIQTLAAMKYRRLERLLRYHRFRIAVVDEAHHAAATTYRNVLVRLGFLPPEESSDDEDAALDAAVLATTLREWDAKAPKDQILIGVTATPNRSDAVGLGCVFQSIVYSYGLKQAIEDGYLVPPVPYPIVTETSLDDVAIRRGEFDQKQLGEAVNNPTRNLLAVGSWLRLAPGRSTIAFTVDVQHAHDLAQAFLAQGVRAAAVSGETPKDERRQMLADFAAGTLTVITNCMVLTEGTDLPIASCILHAKPTKSATLYEQMTGRGLRLFPKKADCLVLDLVDVSRRHSLQTAPVLYGLPPGLVSDGKNLRDLQDAYNRLQADHPEFDAERALSDGQRKTIEQLIAQAKSFDVWTVPDIGAIGEALTFDWMKVGEDGYRIQYPWGDGVEVVKVAKDLLQHFDISLTLKPRAGQLRQRTLAMSVDSAPAALAIAEAFITQERSSVSNIMDKKAWWKKKPASDKQKNLLRKWRIPFRPDITAGVASNLIDLRIARSGR